MYHGLQQSIDFGMTCVEPSRRKKLQRQFLAQHQIACHPAVDREQGNWNAFGAEPDGQQVARVCLNLGRPTNALELGFCM